MMSGQLFYDRHTALNTRCCEYKNSGKKSIPREQPHQNKEMKIGDSVLLSLMSDNPIQLNKVQVLLNDLQYIK